MNATMTEPIETASDESPDCTRYLDDVYRYVRALVASPHDAEDLTQEVFRKAAQHSPKISESDVRGWLFNTNVPPDCSICACPSCLAFRRWTH